MENLSWFILKLFKGLICTAHSFLEWMALLASYCLTVSYYLLKLFSVVLVGVWEIKVFILDNLIPKLLEALNIIACNFLEWMALLASYCQNVSWYLLKLFSTILVTPGEIMVVIMDKALNSIVHSFSEWVALLASYSLNVSCYLLQLLSVVLAGVREIMVVILDNLRVFIPKLFEALYSIARSFSEWMAFLASYSLNVSWYLLKLLSIILVRLWEIMVVIMDNLRIFIPKLFEALNSIAHSFLEWMALLASYSFNVSCYLLKLLSVVLVGIWEIMVVILDNLHTFISMIFDTLINIRYWENSCAILSNLRWLISEIFEASNRLAQGCLEWIALLVSRCFISLCYLLNCFRVVLVSIWENMLSFVANIHMFMSMIFEELTSNGAINSENYWGNFSFRDAFSVALVVLCGAVIIWWCYFMLVLRKDSFGADCKSTPYCWQFKEKDSYSWRSFGPSDNVALEELYCDVDNLEVKVNLKDTASSVVVTPSSQMSVNFEEMSMHSPLSTRLLLRRCSTPSYIQEPNNKSSTQWVWYWEDNAGWKKYTETMKSSGTKQEQIEAAYLNGEGFYPFRSGPHNYILLFYETPMHQVNIDPNLQTRRLVRRRPVFVSKPAYHATKSYLRGKAKDFERTRLKENCEKYRTASQRFHETIPEDQAYIVMVEEIWNEELHERYESKRKRIKRKLKAKRDDQIEKLLFHGTSSDVVDAICKQNFDHRLRGKHATKYGKGSYFAVDASYSNNYSGLGGDKTRFMFLVRVLTGESKLGMPNFRRPPLKDPSDPASDLYDSCVDDENQPKIYVIFNDEQCYPSYLIQYQLL